MRFRTALMHLATFTMLCWLAMPVQLCHAMYLPAFPLPLAQASADAGLVDLAMKAVKELGSIALAFLYCIWVTVKTIPSMAKDHAEERTLGGRAGGDAYRIRQDAGRHREALHRSQREAPMIV